MLTPGFQRRGLLRTDGVRRCAIFGSGLEQAEEPGKSSASVQTRRKLRTRTDLARSGNHRRRADHQVTRPAYRLDES
jgi:hypothetical protein